MLEAWRSGKFHTYAPPGWDGRNWSLLLTPGWRALNGAPLNRIVASQWAATTDVLLDDLAALPADRWCAIDYADLIASPQMQVQRLCQTLHLPWDRELASDLPLARNTLTAPSADKWRAEAAQIEAVLPLVAREDARARAMLEQSRTLSQ